MVLPVPAPPAMTLTRRARACPNAAVCSGCKPCSCACAQTTRETLAASCCCWSTHVNSRFATPSSIHRAPGARIKSPSTTIRPRSVAAATTSLMLAAFAIRFRTNRSNSSRRTAVWPPLVSLSARIDSAAPARRSDARGASSPGRSCRRALSPILSLCGHPSALTALYGFASRIFITCGPKSPTTRRARPTSSMLCRSSQRYTSYAARSAGHRACIASAALTAHRALDIDKTGTSSSTTRSLLAMTSGSAYPKCSRSSSARVGPMWANC